MPNCFIEKVTEGTRVTYFVTIPKVDVRTLEEVIPKSDILDLYEFHSYEELERFLADILK